MDMNSLPGFLQVNPGLIIWTLINFGIFAFIVAKFAWKPMMQGLAAREHSINDAITSAEKANTEAQAILRESKEKIAGAQQEMMNIVRDGKTQAEALIRKASEEAEHVKNTKITEASREIERQKDEAIKELRAEVATLVVGATEKLLARKMDGDDHARLVDGYVNELSKN